MGKYLIKFGEITQDCKITIPDDLKDIVCVDDIGVKFTDQEEYIVAQKRVFMRCTEERQRRHDEIKRIYNRSLWERIINKHV